MTKNLIFVENEDHVRHCLEWYDNLDTSKKLIALSPFAIYELDKYDISYSIPEEYYDSDELYQLGIKNYKKVEEICDILDNNTHEILPKTAKAKIRPAFFNFMMLKMVYDACTLRLFQLERIFEKENPECIYFYDTKIYPYGEPTNPRPLLFDNKESVYSHLLKLYERTYHFEKLPAFSQDKYYTREEKIKQNIIKWLESHHILFNCMIKTRMMLQKRLNSSSENVLTLNKNISALLVGGRYNWNESKLSEMGITPIYKIQDDDLISRVNSLPYELDSNDIKKIWKIIRNDKNFRELFRWGNIDFFPVIEDRFKFLVEKLIEVCLQAYNEMIGLIKDKEIKIVLGSSFSSCVDQSISKASKSLDVPVILWQHGAYGYFNFPPAIYNDIMSSDILFTFGDGVVKEYKKIAKKLNTHVIPVGSFALEKLYKEKYNKSKISKLERNLNINPNKKTVLYITTNFYQNNLYISFHPPLSDNLFWRTQQTIVKLLSKHSNYNFVIKTHPVGREPPIHPYVKEKGYENFRFIRNKYSFTDLLPISDIIVIDLPSTTLLQALTTTKPIFVYLGHLTIDKDARELLQRRAYCFSELNQFINNLDKFLSNELLEIKIDLNNNEFLKKYGIYKLDGESHERAIKIILEKVWNE